MERKDHQSKNKKQIKQDIHKQILSWVEKEPLKENKTIQWNENPVENPIKQSNFRQFSNLNTPYTPAQETTTETAIETENQTTIKQEQNKSTIKGTDKLVHNLINTQLKQRKNIDNPILTNKIDNTEHIEEITATEENSNSTNDQEDMDLPWTFALDEKQAKELPPEIVSIISKEEGLHLINQEQQESSKHKPSITEENISSYQQDDIPTAPAINQENTGDLVKELPTQEVMVPSTTTLDSNLATPSAPEVITPSISTPEERDLELTHAWDFSQLIDKEAKEKSTNLDQASTPQLNQTEDTIRNEINDHELTVTKNIIKDNLSSTTEQVKDDKELELTRAWDFSQLSQEIKGSKETFDTTSNLEHHSGQTTSEINNSLSEQSTDNHHKKLELPWEFSSNPASTTAKIEENPPAFIPKQDIIDSKDNAPKQKQAKGKKRRLKKKYKLLIAFILICLLPILAYAGYSHFHKKIQYPHLAEAKALNILVLGVDKRANDGGRSDTMMLLTFDQSQDKLSILSLPRDTRVELRPNQYEKLNHAYAYGGVKLSQKIVEELLSVPIDYYVEIDLQAFETFIDDIGGLDIDIPKRMYYEDPYDDNGGLVIDFYPGMQHLNGVEAMEYVRYRDEEGDIGRIQRQQQFISAVLNKLSQPDIILKLPKIITHIMTKIDTNLPSSEILKFVPDIPKIKEHGLTTYTLPGTPAYIDGISYWLPNIVADRETAAKSMGITNYDFANDNATKRFIEDYNKSLPMNKTVQEDGTLIYSQEAINNEEDDNSTPEQKSSTNENLEPKEVEQENKQVDKPAVEQEETTSTEATEENNNN